MSTGSGNASPSDTGRAVPIELVCLDMAGTTVEDGGLVESAFSTALDALGVGSGSGGADERGRMLEHVRLTMGTSKIEVFRTLFGEESAAQRANAAFEHAYDDLVAAGNAHPIPGAEEAMAAIRASGRKVALLTGFSPSTRDRLIAALGWNDVADLTLCPAEAGRGRPSPDLVLTALLRLGISDVAAVAVSGDTAADMASGRAAGASIVAGVLTGSDPAERLWAGGATHVLDTVADLPALLR